MSTAVAEDVYQSPEAFLEEVFAGQVPTPEVFWITKTLRPAVNAIMTHRYPALRIKYWQEGTRTAWILEEIGKVKPITTGIVVSGDQIEQLKVLIYRESHGWEVRYPFFTNQFKAATLVEDHRLDRSIDGISGATLSVNALTRLSQLALFLHQQVMAKHG